MATFEEKVLASLARIEKALNIGKTASDVLKYAGMGTWKPAPAEPKPMPKGKITYPIGDNPKVIARVPMYFEYAGDGSPEWYTSTTPGALGQGGQVAIVLPNLGPQTISAVVDGFVVDQINVIAEAPGPR